MQIFGHLVALPIPTTVIIAVINSLVEVVAVYSRVILLVKMDGIYMIWRVTHSLLPGM